MLPSPQSLARTLIDPEPGFYVSNADDIRSLIKSIPEILTQLSIFALGRTAPNPPVAAILLLPIKKDSYLILGGATEQVGARHAEAMLLDRLDGISLLNQKSRWAMQSFSGELDDVERGAGGRLYVTLEPCSHFGRTPSCAQRIKQYAWIKRVIVYNYDPNLKESGIAILKAAGIRVALRTQTAFNFSLRGFINRVQKKRPRLHIKVACSSDSIMGVRTGRLPISGKLAANLTHRLRSRVDAVVVGAGTVAVDMPGLDMRPMEILENFQDQFRHLEPSINCDCSIAGRYLWSDLIESSVQDFGKQYQPDRVFILGQDFSDWKAFLQKQAELNTKTGRRAHFITYERYQTIWQKRLKIAHILSDRDSQVSISELIFFLGQFYNEVLIEGGANLLESLQIHLKEQDLIYLLMSRHSSYRLISALSVGTVTETGPGGMPPHLSERFRQTLIKRPIYLANAGKLITELQLGDDKLQIREI